ncbi:MAG: class I poly(R)-hydroxyalkanoic acid synthase [Rhodobacteraceae bacterium]|nr:class I poly(R)-hydroxyalkanoic acid synthase [Paracoccaceae bacterium]
MTTEETDPAQDLDRLNENLAKVEELSARLMTALSNKKTVRPSLQGPGQDLMIKATAAYMAEMMGNPAKMLEQQVSYWGKSLKHYIEAQQKLAEGKLEAPEDPTPRDRRFSNEMWDTHPYFNFIKQQYLFNSEAITDAVADLEGLDDHDKKRMEYFSQQIVDMFSPANFLGTNPEALARAVETDGESLVQGLENLVHDIERNDGDVQVTLADDTAFRVGENLATTEGSVVFRNRMFELIQYAPLTEKVHEKPLVIFPPWINKFYIMDLKPKNSLIRWIVEQGYTLFVVSWKNPDPSYADVGMEDYIEDGYLTAIEQVKAITNQKKINVAGYCIAGTTLALTLALMKKRGDRSVNSATFFTTLTDFSDQGEVGVFLNDDFVDGIEEEVKEKGILHSFYMSRTFSFLRSNDLIYGPAIKSYMMGEAPPAFDLLYWNGDSTNLPARMTVEYLRWLCQDDKFAKGEIEFLGETLSLKDVSVPLCAIACETDHIAAWAASHSGVRQMGSKDKMFLLSESGHIAGIINPPSKKKYGHYTNEDMSLEAEAWKDTATFDEGSWWPRWNDWLSGRSGKMISARQPGDKDHKVLAASPGTYVLEDPNA